MTSETKDTLHCSFCGKPQRKVEQLVNGPNVRICNECVDICNEIIADNKRAAGAADERAGGTEPPRTQGVVHVGAVACPRCGAVFQLHTQETEGHS